MSAARLQLLWQEAAAAGDGDAAGTHMLEQQLRLGHHDARDVSAGLARRAADEAKLRALARFLAGACEDLSAESAHAAAGAAASNSVWTERKLRLKWQREEQDTAGGGLNFLMGLLAVDEDDAEAIGTALGRQRADALHDGVCFSASGVAV
eukprot:CAMPEP_0198421772 /NCGR_PEP_ID=MMETSP1452-20131203/1892_1 /TAXON_ID=1181717 /ORGANISM="Synchroma pusillum, Strain CCMP3072" /LENGTH=150 /DNA_ID=CAMNT_0044142007 /DNA_START=1 /DNA_END=451 /DNA_ORIENTATION=-